MKKKLLALALSPMLLVPLASHATNGYFTHGTGSKSKSMAGSGVAFPQDAMASATNPAGMSFVGNRLDIGAALFSPLRNYSASDNLISSGFPVFAVADDGQNSMSNIFVIPHVGWNKMLNDSSSFGVTLYGNGGMNTDYNEKELANVFGPPPTGFGERPGVFGARGTGIDLVQAFLNISYSHQVNDSLALGYSLLLAAQGIEIRGLGNFAGFTETANRTGNPALANVSNNDHDLSYGAGVKVGFQAKLSDEVSIGGSYQTRTYMTEFDDYDDVFAEGGDFDIPPTGTIGLAIRPVQQAVFTLDVQKIWYGDIDSISNPISNVFNCPSAVFQFSGQQGGNIENCLGGSDGPGFGWDDMTIYKIGFQWDTNADWIWRVGYSHGDQPIPSSEVLFNILAPAVVEDHFTFGLTKKLRHGEFNFSAMVAPSESVKGPNPFAQGFQEIEIEMKQYELEFSWAFYFD